MIPAAGLVLFTRIDTPKLLEHALRRDILVRIHAQPGARIGDLARTFGVDYKTAEHHVRALARAGRMVLVRDGRQRRCYLPGAARDRPPAPRALLALRALLEGAATPAQLARALHLPRGTAGSLLARLEGCGLAVREEGRWRVSVRGRDALPGAAAAPNA